MVEKCPNNTLGDKEPSKIPLSSFCIGHLLLEMGHASKIVLYTEREAIREFLYILEIDSTFKMMS